jgi:Yip1-like protein
MNAELTQAEPSGASAEEPAMSAPATLIGVFTKPRATFQALGARPRILVPILTVVLFQLVFGLILAQSGVIRNDMVTQLEAKNTPPEQIEPAVRMMDGPMKYVFAFLGPIAVVFSLLVAGAFLYFMANLMLGAKLRYIHYLCIVAYGAVVGTVDQLVRTALAVSRGTLLVNLGIGAFLGEELSGVMRLLDTATDPLLLWATAIQALGVAVMAKKSFGFGVLVVAPGFVALVLLSGLRH